MKPYLACILATLLPALAFGQAIIRPANTGGDVAFGSIDSGAITSDGRLTLTCTACAPALSITGVAGGANAITIPTGAKLALGSGPNDYLTIVGGQVYAPLLYATSLAVNNTITNNSATNGGSIAINDATRWLSTTTALLESSTAATSGTDTAFTLRPLVELSGADRVLDVVDHAGTSRFYVTPAGSIVNSGSATLGTVSSSLYGVAGDNPVIVRGSKVDGASAVGVRIGNLNTLTTAGSKVVAFCADNPSTCASEVASIAHNGTATFSGRISGAGVQAVAGTEPTCDESARGLIWTVAGDTGVADQVKVCAKDAADAFAWRTIY